MLLPPRCCSPRLSRVVPGPRGSEIRALQGSPCSEGEQLPRYMTSSNPQLCPVWEHRDPTVPTRKLELTPLFLAQGHAAKDSNLGVAEVMLYTSVLQSHPLSLWAATLAQPSCWASESGRVVGHQRTCSQEQRAGWGHRGHALGESACSQGSQALLTVTPVLPAPLWVALRPPAQPQERGAYWGQCKISAVPQ